MNMPQLNKRVPIPAPRRKTKVRVPPAVKTAAEDYKGAYKAMYGVQPSVKWDGTWIRVSGYTEGVNARRLREITASIKRRLGTN